MKNIDRAIMLPRVSAGTLTAFGIELRKLRVEKNKRIFDLAHALKVSSSSVSAWETGRRNVPPGEIERIAQILELKEDELDKLKRAAEISRRRVVIEADSAAARQFANAVKKRINSLSPDTIRELLRYFLSSLKGRRPDRRVRYRSLRDVVRVAQMLRAGYGLKVSERFDIVKFYDFELAKIFAETLGDKAIENIRFEIWDDWEMPPETVGMASMFPPHIVISNSRYENAAKGGDAGTWIMAHELGHLFLLHGIDDVKPEIMMRGPEYPSEGLLQHLPEYLADGEWSSNAAEFQGEIPLAGSVAEIPFRCSAETQADDFAAELLMPAAGCAGLQPRQIYQRYGVSMQNAARRLKFVKRIIRFH